MAFGCNPCVVPSATYRLQESEERSNTTVSPSPNFSYSFSASSTFRILLFHRLHLAALSQLGSGSGMPALRI